MWCWSAGIRRWGGNLHSALHLIGFHWQSASLHFFYKWKAKLPPEYDTEVPHLVPHLNRTSSKSYCITVVIKLTCRDKSSIALFHSSVSLILDFEVCDMKRHNENVCLRKKILQQVHKLHTTKNGKYMNLGWAMSTVLVYEDVYNAKTVHKDGWRPSTFSLYPAIKPNDTKYEWCHLGPMTSFGVWARGGNQGAWLNCQTWTIDPSSISTCTHMGLY